MNFTEDVRKNFLVNLSEKQESLFKKYYQKLIEFNEHTNLTTITEEKDVYYKHFYDSLTILKYLNKESLSLCDMGSGAGFPSIPLKIVKEDLKITIIDSQIKRIKFLKELVEKLDLKDVTLIHERIEEYGTKNLNKFDFVTARALGKLNLITEMALPMLKVGGEFISMKGARGTDELSLSRNAIKLTGGKLIEEKYLELPYKYGERSIFVIEKVKEVTGYPRNYAQMLKKPL